MAGKSTISITFKLDGDGKGFKELANDANGLKAVMTAAITEANKLDKSIINWSQSVQAIGAVNNAISQLNSTFQNVTADSAAFSKQMKIANTMAGKDAAGFAQLKGDVASLSKEIPIARDLLANGLYQVISNGVPEDNWITYLKTSARSAVGGVSNLEEVVKVTSTVIKNYGMEWAAAQDIQDKIQLTAKNGVTSFEQLAQALPSVTGQAATLGVSFTEMLAVMSTLTGVTGNTSEVATQLASVLTALTKESEKSQKAAEAMGITFNAASIKAAGGLRNYLQELDATVTAYAQRTGQLKESIYSQLFGRAEAMRLVTALTGQMAEKFDENIMALDNSAGTMDKAFDEMASGGSAVNQMLKNQLGAITDVIAEYGSAVAPVLNFTASLGMSLMSITSLITTFKNLNVVQGITLVRTKAVGGIMLLCGLNANKAAVATRVFSGALTAGAYSATAFKIALRGLLITTGIGVAIAAVTALIEYFCNATEEAEESIDELKEAEDAYTNTAANTKVALDKEIKNLGQLIQAKKDCTDAVNHLNDVYGEVFGKHNKESEWYDILTKKSKIYCQQIGYEAQAKVLATKLAEKQIQLEADYAKRKEMWEKGQARKTVNQSYVTPSGYTMSYSYETDTDDYKKIKAQDAQLIADIKQIEAQLGIAQKHMEDCAKQMADVTAQATTNSTALKVNEMTWQQVSDAIEDTEKKLKGTTDSKKIAELKAYNSQLKARKKLLDQQLGLEKGNSGKKKVAVADPKTYEELSNNIEIYKKKLTGADTAEQRAIREKIALWSKLKQAIELEQKAAERPTELNTLQDIDKELDFQRAIRSQATAENLADIDKEIERLEKLRKQMERNAHVPVPIESISTYEQLNTELSYYTDLLNIASETERASIQKQINTLDDLKKKWDDVLAELKKPGDISTLDSIEELDKAISYYSDKQKKASVDEVQNIQMTIQALEAKKKAMQRGIEIPSMQKEIAEINALSGKDFKLKIKGIGFDELTNRIKDLNKQLNDLDNPVTAGQRKDIERMIGVYQEWRKQTIDTFGQLRNGWDGIKGISSGIDSITNAIEGNGNAWQKTIAIVDGFISIYDGIKEIVTIIELLSTATTAHTVAKTAESAAVIAETTSESAGAVVNETVAASQIPVIAANKLATASYMELAAAEYMAAHAYIPFAGFGIGAGFASSAVAMVEAIGLMPFANGGVISGPVIGLMGEYAGASNNPEVVAPLDKLRSMIEPNSGISGNVEFGIKGRKLVGILKKEHNLSKRS